MFDISWGEVFVVGAMGVALTGRRDLPAACRYAGTQVGRIVGLLQGARARADRFAGHNELSQLQNELRSGLRELDQVKTELALAASSQGVLGRTLGATTASANRVVNRTTTTTTASSSLPNLSQYVSTPVTRTNANLNMAMTSSQQQPSIPRSTLPPVAQTERAVMEDEWEKQGIGFRSRAEQGLWMGNSASEGAAKTGSELLENIIKQNLIFDQYDRVVAGQDAQMQERIDSFKEKRKKDKKDK
jgi:Sec-independent protein translocase protein TatA